MPLALSPVWRLRLATLAAFALLGVVGFALDVPVLSFACRLIFRLGCVAILAWLVWRAYQRLLWRVSGRLAFSYFLIGAVPIPLVAALLALVAYLLSGFFLGYLYRGAQEDLARELTARVAHLEPQAAPTAASSSTEGLRIAVASYQNGRRVEGETRAPATWPSWLAATAPSGALQFVRLADGTTTVAVAVDQGNGRGRVGLLASDLGEALRERTQFWVSPPASSQGERPLNVVIGSASLKFHSAPRSVEQAAEELAEEKRYFEERRGERYRWLDAALVSWPAGGADILDLESGAKVGHVAVNLAASPRMLGQPLFGTDTEVSRFFWVAFLVVCSTLLFLYALAELVAVAMIFGLSRAVSRLYDATTRIARGDFSVRIPVQRTDQVGALQRSFNSMAANLEDLVATAAQKELLEKELEIARDVQQNLLPQNLPSGEAVEFATLFEPSAAIGGDYFDVLRWSPDELAIFVADVSGHGLPTGLRMAMVKAALMVLIDETRDSGEILRRLDGVVRAGAEDRFFVTATLARLNVATGRLALTNAGHPPTYLLRQGAVEEILLPGSPLGGLGHTYGHREVDLQDGDVLVWLSDGLIEGTNAAGEPFGYQRVAEALAGAGSSPQLVERRLLSAIEAHCAGYPPSDDRTLVVMRYRKPRQEADDRSST